MYNLMFPLCISNDSHILLRSLQGKKKPQYTFSCIFTINKEYLYKNGHLWSRIQPPFQYYSSHVCTVYTFDLCICLYGTVKYRMHSKRHIYLCKLRLFDPMRLRRFHSTKSTCLFYSKALALKTCH